MGLITSYGYTKGNPRKLLAPLDSEGNFCGIDGLVDFPYLYF
jgi:hypothetical protein